MSTRRLSRATKTAHVGMGLYEVAVRRVEPITPHLVRVTFAGEQLRNFRDDGPDQRLKLILPRPGQTSPADLDRDDWYASWLALPPDVRPVLRTYTVRAARPEAAELDIDFVLHTPAGPASGWASAARPGDSVVLCAAWAEYELPPGTERQLIAGDHTALPAIAAICERIDADAKADVLIEVPTPADWLHLDLTPGTTIRWLTSLPEQPGRALVDAVTALPDSPAHQYAWVAAEQSTVASIRRHLVSYRHLPPDKVMFMGYWRTGGAIDDD